MQPLRPVVLLLLIAGLAGGVYWWTLPTPPAAIRPGDGVLVDATPVQSPVPDRTPLRHGDYSLQPLARFAVRARLLSVQYYRTDREAELAPIDFALGWGAMSDNRILAQLSFNHSGRYFLWRWPDRPPLPPAQITASAGNMHLIPADPAILAQLQRIGAGRVVQLRGLLVEASAADGWRWRSSLSREDSGGGACELMLVQEVSVE